MLEVLQMFLFLFKSKYRRKSTDLLVCVSVLLFAVGSLQQVQSKCVAPEDCGGHGVCVNETCACYDGWQGSQCQFCGGKVRLGTSNGTIHDGFGNYSIGVKCSWLIDAPNASITIHLEEFATECGWDHLYIYDGDSVNSPLLAVFSGLMYSNAYRIRKIPEVVAQSGTALVHFFSDDAYNMSGFNITYRLNACPSNVSGVDCSGNGVCIDGQCTCNGHWTGEACHLEKCPNNCGAHDQRGSCEPENGCKCSPGFKGSDCSQPASNGYWESILPDNYVVGSGSASHGAAVWKDSLYIISGESYNKGKMLYTYDFNGNVWETPHLNDGPHMRYAHSTVLYGDKLFLYGGICGNRGPTSELWAFDINAQSWENITVKAESCNGSILLCGPLKSAGHTATVVANIGNKKADRMVVIFGHSPELGYLNTVQEYYFGTREWHIVKTRGYPVKGGYGHTAAWDYYTGRIYVYGGVVSLNQSAQVLSKHIYAYDPNDRSWTLLTDAPSARFLHTATFISPTLMIVFGGNTHNDTTHNSSAKCYSSDILAYDAICDTWQTMHAPETIQSDLARFGHSASIFEGSLYIYGGFDGQMLSDILKYTPGTCDPLSAQNVCLNTRPGVKCVWDHKNGRCINIKDVPRTQLSSADSVILRCPEMNRSYIGHRIFQDTEICGEMEDCASCVSTTRKCVWCNTVSGWVGSACAYDSCKDSKDLPIFSLDQCPLDAGPMCDKLHTCKACSAQTNYCKWSYESAKCSTYTPPTAGNNQTQTDVMVIDQGQQCPRVCSEYSSCQNCTQEECIWCQNEGRCVDKNAYISSFPYGRCREWTTVSTKCRSSGNEEKSQCSFYLTCAQCRDDPACGWCDDGSRTGLGKCMPGGYAGPTLHTQSLPSSTCPSERWHFTNCPLCQCNGHASCRGNTSECLPCRGYTWGAHCERCVQGYWGSPINGGQCQPCECNGQATQCHPESGKCYCTTKGLGGDHCEKCDAANHYHGDPTNKGFCYYDLTIDYQFTFNLSKKEDRHYTQINFRNSPTKPDIDADFTITCSVLAKMNITVKRGNSKDEKAIYTGHNCSTFRSRFTKSEYNFGTEDNVTLTTFYVYVYDFQPPLWIQISFSQYPKLNLQQFFITFSTCFLLLLLVAAIMWKIKQRYDMYTRRQRLFVEMEQMASRPFSQVLVEVEVKEKVDADNAIHLALERLRSKKDAPSPIALEPCSGNKAAVLSLLVRLPTGGEPYTVRGQSAGLAIASTLVTLGNTRKLSVDQVKIEVKGGATKTSRKSQSQHPDAGCL
ncbi:PREDICTED: attractin-like protein 1 [Nicrophorus vespilloides]|uniref:Attractin-like protein 1 n=1 Tax=Nicrophorus vespilloides TaxID=110193 RepID=A0ABM1MVX9_NICVS|nr:PREDICTED: attractin-like protein 1 [Nicrophorus vespilloides]